jgi:hypothetical protein
MAVTQQEIENRLWDAADELRVAMPEARSLQPHEAAVDEFAQEDRLTSGTSAARPLARLEHRNPQGLDRGRPWRPQEYRHSPMPGLAVTAMVYPFDRPLGLTGGDRFSVCRESWLKMVCC